MREADNPTDIIPNSGPGKRKVNPTEKANDLDQGGSPPNTRPVKKKKAKEKSSPCDGTAHPTSLPPVPPNLSPAVVATPTPSQIISAEDKFAHRKDLPGHPANNCAADHPHFKRSSALAFQFLIVLSSESDADGDRTISKLQCALCHKSNPKLAIWTLPKDWDSSMGNQNKHFREKHKLWWAEV